MANGNAKHGARDVYGFRLSCTPEEEQTRQQCEQRQAQQLQAWEKYWKRRRLPKDEKLKKLCRKVRLPAHKTLVFLLKPKMRSPTAIGACWALPTYTGLSHSCSYRTYCLHLDQTKCPKVRDRVPSLVTGRPTGAAAVGVDGDVPSGPEKVQPHRRLLPGHAAEGRGVLRVCPPNRARKRLARGLMTFSFTGWEVTYIECRHFYHQDFLHLTISFFKRENSKKSEGG